MQRVNRVSVDSNFVEVRRIGSPEPFLKREFSSAGLEHLPYKQRVGGSNPSTPTKQTKQRDVEQSTSLCFHMLWHKLVCKHRYMKTKEVVQQLIAQ